MDTSFSLTFAVILLGVPGRCEEVTVYSGQLGETLNVVCPYQQRADRWRKKVWCKEDEDGFCQLVVSAHPYWMMFNRRTNGSADIADDQHKGVITINMTNLQRSDAGLYQCRTVTFGDVTTLQRIRVQVLDSLDGNVPEHERTQYSISGSPSETQIPVMLIVVGSSLIFCKLLLMGVLCIWGKRQEAIYSPSLDLEQFSTPLSAGSSDAEQSFPSAREETSPGPHYINYMYMGHLNQGRWQQ
ncbi:triggering receptor expressed on myeloid cells 2-like [Dendropsophus ebraccatus]|uniref:triggering receptor expressed on myeloid cells 2-like n=1 Tax=Dendropsophus ebraccatus TaxID=150705 RepID=UPI003831AA7A